MPSTTRKIVFFGTSDFSVPILERLHGEEEFEILEVVTRPDRPSGRKRVLTAPAVKRAAETFGLKVHQPESLRDPATLSRLKSLGADVFIVVSYGKILPKELLDAPPFGGVNVHASLLPAYRGASPINAAIMAGDKETGVTVMKMDEKMDEGPILSEARVAIGEEDTTATLSVKLSAAAADLLSPTLKVYLAGGVKPTPQDHSKASYCGILKREDGKIDWSKSAAEIERFIRAMQPWPEAFTHWAREGKPALKLIIKKASVLHPESRCEISGKTGAVCKLSDGTVGVDCGTGSLWLKTIQLEGKNPMDAKSFLNGYPDFIGAELV